MLNRRTFMYGLAGLGSATLLELTVNGSATWLTTGAVASLGKPDTLSLTPEEVSFLGSGWADEEETEARRLLRHHGARIDQLRILASAAGLSMWPCPAHSQPVRWPWKNLGEFHQRLQEAHVQYRRSLPASKISPVENLRFVGFRPDEAGFLLCWYQEDRDWSFSYEEWGKGWRHYPTHRIVKESLPTFGCDQWTLIRFSLALFDELGLTQFEASALPLKNVQPSIPWKTIDEFRDRLRDLAAYEIRKDKAESVSGARWQNVPLNFSRQELAFLDAWLQEQIRRQPGPAHTEQTSRGVLNAQLINLVWASNMEIEPRAVMTTPWPWRSQDEFNGRLSTLGEIKPNPWSAYAMLRESTNQL